MTENEKLRALLAEAREALRPLSLSADGFAQMRQRIDAALAEPVDFLMPTTDAKEVRWEMVQMLKRERDEARAERGELLAIIHRDGGHYVGQHGLTKAVADAHATWAAVVQERDEARAEVKELRAVLTTAGNRLRSCGEQLTEHAYQEMASVLFDLPQTTGDES